MTREEAKTYVKEQEPSFLLPAKKMGRKQSYICPVCGNGSGKDGTGITRFKTNKGEIEYSCFKCKALGNKGSYDIISLFAYDKGLDIKDKTMFDAVYSYYGVIVDDNNADFSPIQPRKAEQRTNTPPAEEKTDFTSYFEECIKNNDYKYLLSRGISIDTQKKFKIGLDKSWSYMKDERCIIPNTIYNYTARATYTDIMDKKVRKGGKNVPIFNLKALEADKKAIFIVEGEIDCISIEEVGYSAIGLGGANNTHILLEYLESNYKGHVFVIIADQDEEKNGMKTGEEAQKRIVEGFEKLSIPYVIGDVKAHDANNALVTDRQAFIERLELLHQEAEALYKERNKNEYSALDIIDYFENIEDSPQYYEASTGFKELDKHLYGGLHEGLYIIGAISSLGKTTFMLQLADQVAKAGKDVLFFSLEMSKHEIMAKSLSRYTFKQNGRQRTSKGDFIAKDTAQILNGKRYAYYTESEKEAIKSALNAYKSEVAPHFYIYEGGYKGERLTANHIRQIVKDHIAKTGNSPIVIVDYLQILASPSNLTDKQATDESVYILKDISRTYTIPVIAISSFNRDNYNNPVSMASFKESGAIEYSSDILLGLQYAGMDYQTGEGGEKDKPRAERIRTLVANNFEKKRNKEPIDIELKCLKARTGYQFTVAFKMVNAFNSFEEVGADGDYIHEGSTPFEADNNPFAELKALRKKV